MDSQDTYIVKRTMDGTGACFFYKNGLLHREAGPAIVTLSDRDTCLQLGDEHLYKEESISGNFPEDYKFEYILENKYIDGRKAQVHTIPVCYLDGKPYSNEEFQEIKTKLDLKTELNSELPSIHSNNKKAKI
jgi:hypothetical protein